MRISQRLLGPAVLSVPMLLLASAAHAGNVLAVVDTKIDPPTVITLGVQVLITDDDNFDAAIDVRYRATGTTDWKSAQSMFRVHPEAVAGYTVAKQFGVSIFDLKPGTSYDIELKAHDPDGFDKTWTVSATTRSVPKDPPTPHIVSVTDSASLDAALGAAKAGDVITLKNGTYAGVHSFGASGAADNPIVVRGESMDGVVLDGGGCTGCNIFEIYGSFVQIESLTIQNGERAVRWQTGTAVGNVLRRLHVKDVTLGIGGKDGQKDFYICDNVFEGRLRWPTTYGTDGAAHANDDGLVVQGTGMVVCHNTISGFSDSIQNRQDGTRGNDFYGNDSLWNYDDGIELDGTEGNSRCFRNRWTNSFDTLSFQPIHGGPAYVFRNVIVNVAGEPMKLHAQGGATPQDPIGELIYNNTFVRAGHAIQISTPNVAKYYALENNLFVTNATPTGGIVVEWDTPIDYITGLFDFDGYFPDGTFHMGYGATGTDYPNFAAMVAGGRYEKHGALLAAGIFASGLVAPTDWMPKMDPQDVTLAAGSSAIDKGTTIANVTDGYKGAAPDLGALERDCPLPIFGPRPVGTDESNEPTGCPSGTTPGDAGTDGGPTTDSGPASDGGPGKDGGPGSDSSTSGDGGGDGSTSGADSTSSGGCGCRVPARDVGASGTVASLVAIGAAFARRRRRGCRSRDKGRAMKDVERAEVRR